jgi:NAD(P)-dependent dehydrogenase (short-subunit alcohol dehydrogenase family)
MKSAESVQLFFTAARDHWGRLDSIISATGPPITLGPLTEASPELFKLILETDVIGSLNVVQQGVPVLKAEGRPGASLLLFVTCAVLKTLDWDGLSFIPKMAVVGIIKQAAREIGAHGLRINGLAPGTINAGIVLASFKADSYGAAVLDTQVGQTPLGRRGEADEVAEVAAFLVSPQASYVSGQIMGVDGGYSA